MNFFPSRYLLSTSHGPTLYQDLGSRWWTHRGDHALRHTWSHLFHRTGLHPGYLYSTPVPFTYEEKGQDRCKKSMVRRVGFRVLLEPTWVHISLCWSVAISTLSVLQFPLLWNGNNNCPISRGVNELIHLKYLAQNLVYQKHSEMLRFLF